MEWIKRYKTSIWRVPLICVIAGFLYVPIYVRIMVRFGILESGMLDYRISFVTSIGLFLATLLLGGGLLLRKRTRKEIFVSASVMVIYGLILHLLRLIMHSTSGLVAVVLLRHSEPFEWTFSPHLSSYLYEQTGHSLPLLGWLSSFEPLLFVVFGQKSNQSAI